MKQESTVVKNCFGCEAGEYCSEKLFFVKQESTVVKNCSGCVAGEYCSEKPFSLSSRRVL